MLGGACDVGVEGIKNNVTFINYIGVSDLWLLSRWMKRVIREMTIMNV